MTTDRNGNTVRYGRINAALIRGWAQLDEAADGSFWALNLMKYREHAEYADGRASTKSGRDADDEYTPREALAGIGAEIAFAADVERIERGDGTAWDRVAIVRYPSRRAFLAMQQRDDFKQKHVHKDAGMEFTIVMSTLPVRPFGGAHDRHPYIELTLTDAPGPGAAASDATGVFDVEGVIIGDERTWRTATFRWLDAPRPLQPAVEGDRATYTLLLRPMTDRLTRTVEAAG